MKKIFLLFICMSFLTAAFSQRWRTNFGIDGGGWWGLSGMSELKPANNPLVNNDLPSTYSWSADFYADFYKLRIRKNTQWGAILPGIGFKTKLDWEFFDASNGGGESVGLNFLDIPFLFEYCLGFHQGVAAAHVIPGSSTTTTYDHPELNYTHVITVTRGEGYDPGGYPVSRATFIYAGPQICNLFKSFHDTPSGNTSPINDPNLRSTYMGLVGGFSFWLNSLNVDLSYQKGLQSIYSGKDVYINGFIFKLGVNFSRRIFN